MPGHDGVYCIVSDGKLDCSIQGLNMLSPVGTYTGRLRPRGLAASPLYNIFDRKGTPSGVRRKSHATVESTLSLASGSCYGKSWLELTLHFAYLTEVYSSELYESFFSSLVITSLALFFVFTYLRQFFRAAHAYGQFRPRPSALGEMMAIREQDLA